MAKNLVYEKKRPSQFRSVDEFPSTKFDLAAPKDILFTKLGPYKNSTTNRISTKITKPKIFKKFQRQVVDHEPGQLLGILTLVVGQRSLTSIF